MGGKFLMYFLVDAKSIIIMMYRLAVYVIMDLKRSFEFMGEFIREDIHASKAQRHFQFFSHPAAPPILFSRYQ